MARKFFYVCAGMLMLALSFYFGAQSAAAQAGGREIVAVSTEGGSHYVYTSTGDCYRWIPAETVTPTPAQFMRNVWDGQGPTTNVRQSWGEVKQRYAKPGRAGVTQGGADR